MKKNVVKIIFFILALFVISVLIWLVRNLIIDIIIYAKNNDNEAIKNLIKDHGAFSYLSIILVEAVQMIIVVIPAEFIQLAAGISFPPLIAMSLCFAGIFLGATVIYFLVNVLKFDHTALGNKSLRVDELAQRNANMSTQAIMYLLFITPIIPFGAICYFASTRKISYWRYIFTCLTGVIPAVVSSVFLGNGMVWLTSLGIPMWAIILIIIFVMILIFYLLMLFVKHKYFDGSVASPNAGLYTILLKMFRVIVRTKANVKTEKELVKQIDGPVVYVSNHASFYDMYYACNLIFPKRAAIIGNRYYFRNRYIRRISKQIGVIPKKLFSADLETIKLAIKSVKDNHSIVLFPEGRLSLDGTSYNIIDGTGALVKKLNLPLVIANINGAYLTNPKWRKKRIKGNVLVNIKSVLMPEELSKMSSKEIDHYINENIKINDFEFARVNNLTYKGNNKAKGLENVLFVCPHCKKEYTLETHNNVIRCTNCHEQFEIDNNYSFKDNKLNITDIHHFYQITKDYQKELLYNNPDYCLETKVKVKKLDLLNKKKDKSGIGTITLTKDMIKFVGFVDGKEVEMEHQLKNLKGLAFSCGSEFEFYYHDELYFFYPENGKVCVQYAMIVDIVNELENNNE